MYAYHQGITTGPANFAPVCRPPPTYMDAYAAKSQARVPPPPQQMDPEPTPVAQGIQPPTGFVWNQPGAPPPPQPSVTQKPVVQVIQPPMGSAWNQLGAPIMYPPPLHQQSDGRDYQTPAPYGVNPSAGPAVVGQPWRSGKCLPPVVAPASTNPSNLLPGSAQGGRSEQGYGGNVNVRPPRVPESPILPQSSGRRRLHPPPDYRGGDPPDSPPDPSSSPSSGSSRGGRRAPAPPPGTPQNANANRPKTPQFSGKTGEWENFEYRFERVARKLRWDDQEKLDQLTTNLHDKALSFVRSLPPGADDDFNTLMGHLRRRFRSLERPDILRRQLPDVRQRVDENLEDFADRIREMASSAYRSYGCMNTVDDAGIEAFLRGLRDRNVSILAANRGPFVTIQAALDAAQHTEANQKTLGRGSATGRHVSFTSDVTSEPVDVWQVYSPKKKVISPSPRLTTTNSQRSVSHAMVQTSLSASDIMPSRPTSSPSSSPRRRRPSPHDRCFHCNELGHFRSNCPSLDRSPKGNGRQ